jgi:hypothetical protein
MHTPAFFNFYDKFALVNKAMPKYTGWCMYVLTLSSDWVLMKLNGNDKDQNLSTQR